MRKWFEQQDFFSSSSLAKIEAWSEQQSVFIFGEC